MLSGFTLSILLINCQIFVTTSQDNECTEGAIESWKACPDKEMFCGHCTYYTKCVEGRYKPTRCPDKEDILSIQEGEDIINVYSAQVYDPDREECVEGNITTALSPNSCHSYTQCLVISTEEEINAKIKNYQILTEHKCSGLMFFDSVLKHCVDSSPTECVSKVCTETTCLNEGICIEAGNDNFYCMCETGWSGTRCEFKEYSCDSCEPGYECFADEERTQCLKRNYEFQTMDDEVMSIAFGSGNILASVLADGTIQLWDTETGNLSQTLDQNGVDATSIVFGSSILASGSADKAIRLWDPSTGIMLKKLGGHTDVITSIAFGGEDFLASGSADNTVRVWNPVSGDLLRTFDKHKDTVTSIAFSENKTLASGSNDKTVMLWSLESGDLLMNLTEHTDSVTSVAFLNNTVLASGSADKTVRLWDLNTGVLLRTFDHVGPVTSIAFSADGVLVSGSGSDGNVLIKLWDPETGGLLNVLDAMQTGDVTSIAFSVDDMLACACGKSIKLWDLFGREAITTTNEDK